MAITEALSHFSFGWGALFEDLLPHELLWAWFWEPYALNPHTEISALKEQL